MCSKKCKTCQIEKPSAEFYFRKNCKDSLSGECKSCWLVRCKRWRESNPVKYKETNKKSYERNREERIKKQKQYAAANPEKIKEKSKEWKAKNPNYSRISTLKKHGLTRGEFESMIKMGEKSCWICSAPFKKLPDVKIDHCHNTGVVRGLLCSHCNTAIGLVKENESVLRSMIDYLKNKKDGWKEF